MTAFLGDFFVKSYMCFSNTLSILWCSAAIFLKLPLKILVMQRSHAHNIGGLLYVLGTSENLKSIGFLL